MNYKVERTLNTPTEQPPTAENNQRHKIVFLHGLFGYSDNWRLTLKMLAKESVLGPCEFYTVDLRNHGRSPHTPNMQLEDIVGDLSLFVDTHVLGAENKGGQVSLCGHSMGGKVAMLYAFAHPRTVKSLVCVDVAPASYITVHDHDKKFFAMQQLTAALPHIHSRLQADEFLSIYLPDKGERQYLLSSLVESTTNNSPGSAGQTTKLQWAFNLEVLQKTQNNMLGFPDIAQLSNQKYEGPTLFIGGKQSHYLKPPHATNIPTLFPNSEVKWIEGGHHVYAQKQKDFVACIRDFWKPK